MLIDGERALRLAMLNNVKIESIFFKEEAGSSDLLEETAGKKILLQPVSNDVFSKISYGGSPDHFIGLASQPEFSLQNMSQPENAIYLVAEGIEKPGNLGAILRSADAAGVTGLLLCNSRTDIYNPNVIRASRGAFFSVPIADTTSEAALIWLKDNDIHIYAASPYAELLYTKADFTGPSAIAIGAEHEGLSAPWLKEDIVKIPMKGQIDSLNVAQSASILIFEALRQRL